MRMLLPALLFCLLAPLSVALAQEQPKAAAKPNDVISPFTRLGYGYVKSTLLRSAEKMPEENYNFRPVWVVRSFGQLIGHVADAEYYFCSRALGEKNPALNIQKTKTSKADLIAALKDAFAYCDRAFDSMTEATANQTVKFQGIDLRKVDVLTASLMHTVEHYGNLIVYMRMKNIVPPSTEPDFNPQAKK
ncbi:MAG TPA: DinB family protein [Blastocatellia bacterium]|nr:DinB family protein [Blastocatellia bacterium]